MNVRAICIGHFVLPLSAVTTLELFTPEGERRWAGSSWSPVYAIPEAARTTRRLAQSSRPKARAAGQPGSCSIGATTG
jgi:hypothetical protein